MILRKIFTAAIRTAAGTLMASTAIGCTATAPTPAFIDASNGIAYRLGNYNNVLTVTIQSADSGKILWQLNRDISFAYGPTQFEQFDYGKPPPNMKVVIPAQPLSIGDRVVVDIQYQFDTPVSANTTNLYSTYEVVGVNSFKKSARD
jgi:hypothetical protein